MIAFSYQRVLMSSCLPEPHTRQTLTSVLAHPADKDGGASLKSPPRSVCRSRPWVHSPGVRRHGLESAVPHSAASHLPIDPGCSWLLTTLADTARNRAGRLAVGKHPRPW